MSVWSVASHSQLLRAGNPQPADAADGATAARCVDGKLTVTGTGTVRASADVYGIALESRAEAADPEAARGLVITQINTALERAKELKDKVIVTRSSTYSSPVYTSPKPGEARKLVGYRVSGSLSLEASSPKELRESAATITEGLQISVKGFSYELRNRYPALREATQRAASRARELAAELAKSTGTRLDRVVLISTNREIGRASMAERSVPSSSADGGESGVGSLPIVYARIPVTATVTIVYEIDTDASALVSQAAQKIGADADDKSVSSLDIRVLQQFYSSNIERETMQNENYRKVLFTTRQQQLVVMSLEPGEFVPEEVHRKMTQFVRIEQGNAEVTIDGNVINLEDDDIVVVPFNSSHSIKQRGPQPLKMYIVYSSGNGKFDHKEDEVQERQFAQK